VARKRAERAPEATSTINLASLRSVIEPQGRESLDKENRRIVDELEPESAMFIIQQGPGKGSRYLINRGSTELGREVSADIVLDDVTVSRKHARIDYREGFQIHDLQSLNGTYVNSRSITSHLLHEGDEVQIGKYRLTFYQGSK
jgi:pSer/pThr/pTyr-binding forkhead associated (FHA) protein